MSVSFVSAAGALRRPRSAPCLREPFVNRTRCVPQASLAHIASRGFSVVRSEAVRPPRSRTIDRTEELRTEYSRILGVLRELRSRGEWSHSIAVCENLLDSELASLHDPRLYAELLFALMKRSLRADANEALLVWKELYSTKRGRPLLGPRTYQSLMQLLCKFCLLDEAVKVKSQGRVLGFHINRFVYNSFLNCCAKRRRLEDAFRALREMADDGCEPDVVSFNCVIACCVNCGDLDMALTLLERMKKWKVVPDIYSFNSIVNGLRKHNRLDEAFELVARMEIEAANYKRETKAGEAEETHEEVGIQTVAPSDGPEPDVCTYNTLLAGLAQMQVPDLRRALRLKKHMEARGLVCNEVTYNAVMATAARGNHVREAFSIYNEMLSSGIRPNCECFTTLITLCARARMLNRAFSFHDHMIEMHIKPTVVTYNALVTACRHALDGDRALDVLKCMKSRSHCQPDVVSYSTIIDTLGRVGRLEDAMALVDEMKRNGIEPNQVTYTCVIAAQTRVGDLDGALRTLSEMESKGVQPNVYTYSSLVNGAARRGAFELAFELLETMRLGEIQPNVVTYVTLVEYAVRNVSPAHVKRAVAEMARDRIIAQPEQYERIVALSLHKRLFLRDRRVVTELLHNIRHGATKAAWGGLTRRMPLQQRNASLAVGGGTERRRN